MISKAVDLLIISCMENHVYKFNNTIRKQLDGGPIGLGLTCEIADCFMIRWEKQFLKKYKDIGICIVMYSRFKGNTFISALAVDKGMEDLL